MPNPASLAVRVASIALASFLAHGLAYADFVAATVPVGATPNAVAVNPLTGRAYVANVFGSSVTVVDGASGTALATVAVGTSPVAVAVDPAAGRVYVANQLGASVSVIDAASNAVLATVPAGTNPFAVAVDSGAHKAYVANAVSNDVTVIDGTTNVAVATVAVGTLPLAVAVNPVTHRVYVVNQGSNDVSVIDGTTNAVIATVAVAASPSAVAVNPATGRVYVANQGGNSVSVIDGVTDTVIATVPTASSPVAVAVNPVSNRIYTAEQGGDATVIDGASNTATTVAAGLVPTGVAVNVATNKAYVTNLGSNTVTVIDGATNATATVGVGAQPSAVAVDAATDRVFVTNQNSNNVTIIREAAAAPVPIVTTIGALPGNQTASATPVFAFTASSTFAPIAPPVRAVYYQVDSIQGPWQQATGTGPFGATLAPLTLGVHVLYAFAVDGQEATTTNPSSPLIGRLAAYAFVVMPPGVPGAPVIGAAAGGNALAVVSFAPPAFDGGSPVTGYVVTCNPGTVTVAGPGSPVVVGGLTNGTTYSCTVSATNAFGTGPPSAAAIAFAAAGALKSIPTLGERGLALLWLVFLAAGLWSAAGRAKR